MGYPPHIADDPLALVILPLEDIDAVLHTASPESFKLHSQEILVLLLRDIIGKHHEHGAGRVGGVFVY